MSCYVSLAAAITPLGPTLAASQAAYLADLSPHAALERLLDRHAAPITAAEISGLSAISGRDRIAEMVARVVGAAVDCLPVKFDLLLALPINTSGRLGDDFGDYIRAVVEDALPEGRKIDAFGAVSEDHAAAFLALKHAKQRFDQTGGPVVVIAADSMVCPQAILVLQDEERLMSSDTPHGVIPGEAAAMVLLTSERPSTRNAMRFRGVFAASREIDNIKTPQRGETLARTAREALGVPQDEIRPHVAMVTDMNGEPWRGDELGLGLVRLSQDYDIQDMPTVIANRFGDTGAASGILELAAAEALFTNGAITAPTLCCCTSAPSGLRCALAVDFEGPGEQEPLWVLP